ncbi:MAG: hypothetical protein ACI4AM_07450 [Muribaculaceae bacterium]
MNEDFFYANPIPTIAVGTAACRVLPRIATRPPGGSLWVLWL